jgi:hypothetical protein
MKVASWKLKQSQADIAEDDPQIVLRRILLNSLMKATVPKEKVIASARRQFGFKRQDVLRAATWWNCVEETRHGEVHWRKPDVLVALPSWHYGRPSQAPVAHDLACKHFVQVSGRSQ